jgi:hypothetical protein
VYVWIDVEKCGIIVKSHWHREFVEAPKCSFSRDSIKLKTHRQFKHAPALWLFEWVFFISTKSFLICEVWFWIRIIAPLYWHQYLIFSYLSETMDFSCVGSEMSVCCSRRNCYTCPGTVIFLYIYIRIRIRSFVENVFLSWHISNRNMLYFTLTK